jgi:hypothetical protein
LLRASAVAALILLGQHVDGYDGSAAGWSKSVENDGLTAPFAGGRNVVCGLAGIASSTVSTAPNCSHVVAAQLAMLTTLMIEVPAGAA